MSNIEVVSETQTIVVESEAQTIVVDPVTAVTLVVPGPPGSISVVNSGPVGPRGYQGVQGIQGIQGETGQGVPQEGALGQVLTKQSGVDYHAEWQDSPSLTELGVKRIIKTADQTINSLTTLQNDNELVLPVGIDETWLVRFVLFITGQDATDFKVSFLCPPAYALYRMHASGLATSANTSNATAGRTGSTSTPGQVVGSLGLSGAGGDGTNVVTGDVVLVNDNFAGNLQLQWAQQNSDPASTTVKAGSFMIATRVS